MANNQVLFHSTDFAGKCCPKCSKNVLILYVYSDNIAASLDDTSIVPASSVVTVISDAGQKVTVTSDGDQAATVTSDASQAVIVASDGNGHKCEYCANNVNLLNTHCCDSYFCTTCWDSRVVQNYKGTEYLPLYLPNMEELNKKLAKYEDSRRDLMRKNRNFKESLTAITPSIRELDKTLANLHDELWIRNAPARLHDMQCVIIDGKHRAWTIFKTISEVLDTETEHLNIALQEYTRVKDEHASYMSSKKRGYLDKLD